MGERRLIDANAFMMQLREIKSCLQNELKTEKIRVETVDFIERHLSAAPVINPESLRPVARLGPVDPESDIEFKCSKCEGIISTDWDGIEDFEYCPYCGARAGESI